jgi:hypothetical protein
LSCLVLSCLVLSCLVLSCSDLFCVVLVLCFVLCCVLSCLALPYLVLSCLAIPHDSSLCPVSCLAFSVFSVLNWSLFSHVVLRCLLLHALVNARSRLCCFVARFRSRSLSTRWLHGRAMPSPQSRAGKGNSSPSSGELGRHRRKKGSLADEVRVVKLNSFCLRCVYLACCELSLPFSTALFSHLLQHVLAPRQECHKDAPVQYHAPKSHGE